MDLTVILGPPGSGKAARAVDALRQGAQRHGDAFLVVPGSVERARFLRELAAAGEGVLVGVEVGTFEQLVQRVAGSPPVRRTDRTMERIIVRDALEQVDAFRAAAGWSGFIDTARMHVGRLRRARAWGGSEIERVEAELPGERVDAWRELEQRVAALLDERRLRDDAWFERRAAQQLLRGKPGVGAVVAYGFGDLNGSHLELIERLAGLVPVHVALAWRPGRRIHERAADLRDRWRSKGAFIDEVPNVASTDVHPVLAWLGEELFEEAVAPVPPQVSSHVDAPAPVTFVDCCGSTQEAEEVVREVALLRSRGLDWDDIVVASVSVDSSAQLLTAMFDRAGIPARVQARRRAIDIPVGRALHDLLDAAMERDAIKLVAALRAPVFGHSRTVLDRVELQLRRGRHDGRAEISSERVLRALTDPVRTLVEVASGRSGGDVDAFRSVLAALLPGDLGELDLLRGVAALVEGLVVAAADEARVELADVRDAIARFTLPAADRSDSGAVVIASIEDLRSIAYHAVVLHGLHLTGFQARVDDEVDAPGAARDLLYLAITRARRTIRVIRQSAGADGGHLAPSPAWQELRRLLPDAPVRTRRLGQVVVEPGDVRLDSERALSAAFHSASGEVLDGVDSELDARLRRVARRVRAPQLTGPKSDGLAGRSTLAVTELERYVTCSARWFIEKRLRDQDPDDDRSRIVDGLLAHALLQHVLPDARRDSLDANAIRGRARELVPELLEALDQSTVPHASRIERIIEDVVALIGSETDWPIPDSIDVERSFGEGADDSIGRGFVVDEVELVGRIDRIDRFGSHVVLHDYKYGSADRTASKLIQDHNLQLLVYWLALDQPGSLVQPVGALYRAVKAGGRPSGVVTGELKDLGIVGPKKRALAADATRALLEEARKEAHDAIDGMRSGIVRPLADKSQCPSHCSLQLICRIGEVATA